MPQVLNKAFMLWDQILVGFIHQSACNKNYVYCPIATNQIKVLIFQVSNSNAFLFYDWFIYGI